MEACCSSLSLLGESSVGIGCLLIQGGRLEAVRRLKSGKYSIEPTVRSILVRLWDFLDSHPDSTGYRATVNNPWWKDVKPIIEKMRCGESMSADEVRRIVKWRGPLGTILADPDRGVAYFKFIKQYVAMGMSRAT